MIVFNLGCENNHRFEGWFASADEFDQQQQRKLVTCPLCNNANIVRFPNATRINKSGSREQPTAGGPVDRQYTNVARESVARLIERIIENTEDVGSAFPEEARRIYYRESPVRQIRGTASREEVEELTDEGIEVVALPISVTRTGRAH